MVSIRKFLIESNSY